MIPKSSSPLLIDSDTETGPTFSHQFLLNQLNPLQLALLSMPFLQQEIVIQSSPESLSPLNKPQTKVNAEVKHKPESKVFEIENDQETTKTKTEVKAGEPEKKKRGRKPGSKVIKKDKEERKTKKNEETKEKINKETKQNKDTKKKNIKETKVSIINETKEIVIHEAKDNKETNEANIKIKENNKPKTKEGTNIKETTANNIKETKENTTKETKENITKEIKHKNAKIANEFDSSSEAEPTQPRVIKIQRHKKKTQAEIVKNPPPKPQKRTFAELDPMEPGEPPLFIGSFLIRSPCLPEKQVEEILEKRNELELWNAPFEDYAFKKNEKGGVYYKIEFESLRTYLNLSSSGPLFSITHFCDKMWSFLLTFRLIDIKCSVLKDYAEGSARGVVFQQDVYLNQRAEIKGFELDHTLREIDKPKSQPGHEQRNSIFHSKHNKKFRHEEQAYRKEEIRRYIKESMVILLDLLKIKKVQNSVVDVKKKISLFKKFANNFQSYPELYQQGKIISNLTHTIFDNEDDKTIRLFSQFSIFPEPNPKDHLDKAAVDPEAHREFLLYINSNHFVSTPTPSEMKTQLYEYQQQALSWFLFREQVITEDQLYKNPNHPNTGANRKLNPIYEEYQLPDSKHLFFNVFTGQLGMSLPNQGHCRGGILADEMGLGKTVMALALIYLNKPRAIVKRSKPTKPNKKIKLDEENEQDLKTLIIVPLSILDQWHREIKLHSLDNGESLKVGVFYGNVRKSFDLDDYTVILMTYDGLVQDFKRYKKTGQSVLYEREWLRIILDEAHYIKNRKSLRSEACCKLKGRFRWCLTGTPIQNQLDDLFSLVRFLKLEIFGEEYHFWNTYINNSPDFLGLLKQTVGPLLLRRMKTSVNDKGEPILKLPAKRMSIVRVTMLEEERKVYEGLYKQSRDKFLFFLRSGTALKNYSGIFAMIMRLRQCCDHPSLVYRELGSHEAEDEIMKFLTSTEDDDNGKDEESDSETSDSDDFDSEENESDADQRHEKREKENMKNQKEKEKKEKKAKNVSIFAKNAIPELVEKMRENKFENCPICFGDMIEPTLTKCCHIGCFECIHQAVKQNACCPICRTVISTSGIRKICRFVCFIEIFNNKIFFVALATLMEKTTNEQPKFKKS